MSSNTIQKRGKMERENWVFAAYVGTQGNEVRKTPTIVYLYSRSQTPSHSVPAPESWRLLTTSHRLATCFGVKTRFGYREVRSGCQVGSRRYLGSVPLHVRRFLCSTGNAVIIKSQQNLPKWNLNDRSIASSPISRKA